MTKPKLILLYGFAGIGKTTIAKRYVSERALAMNLDQDRIIEMLGLWPEHETEARKLVSELSKVLIETYLQLRHDIVVPCLPTKTERIQDLEAIAKDSGAQFFEVAFTTDREDAIKRLRKRGTWGEEGTAPLTNADLPTIEKLYDDMIKVLNERPNIITVTSIENDQDGTYQKFLKAVTDQQP